MSQPVLTPFGSLTYHENLQFERVQSALNAFFDDLMTERLAPAAGELRKRKIGKDVEKFLEVQFREQVKEAVAELRKESDHRSDQITKYFNQWRRADDMLDKVHATLKSNSDFAELVLEIEAARTPEPATGDLQSEV